MHIHEYLAKKILNEIGVKTPKSAVISSISEAQDAYNSLAEKVLVKAQIHSGDRANSGGVIFCNNYSEVASACQKLLGSTIITSQTDSAGLPVNQVLIEEAVAIKSQFYLSILIDRSAEKITVLASSEGGTDIEKVALASPQKIIRVNINDPKISLENCLMVAEKLAVDEVLIAQFCQILSSIYTLFIEKDLSLIEINPLVISSSAELLALDAKLDFDDNALFRHPEIAKLHDQTQTPEKEQFAAEHQLSYISMAGEIGCMVNGAGLAMATMDLIAHHGGSAANFLDVGGGTTKERVATAFELIQSEPAVKAILVNIFGGIVRCDLIAKGIIQALEKVGLSLPLVVRLAGTNAKLGLQILASSDFDITTESDLTEAAKKAVKLAK